VRILEPNDKSDDDVVVVAVVIVTAILRQRVTSECGGAHLCVFFFFSCGGFVLFFGLKWFQLSFSSSPILQNSNASSSFSAIRAKHELLLISIEKEGIAGGKDDNEMSGGGGDEGVDLTAATSNWFSDVGGKLYAGATKLVDDLDKFDDQLGEQMENAAKAVVEKAAEAKSKLDEVGGVSNFIGVSGLNLISPRDTTNDVSKTIETSGSGFKDERVESLKDALRVARNEIARQEDVMRTMENELEDARAATARAASLAVRNAKNAKSNATNDEDENKKRDEEERLRAKKEKEMLETELASLKEKLRNAVKKGKSYESDVERLTRELATAKTTQQNITTAKGKKGKKGNAGVVPPPLTTEGPSEKAMETMKKEKEELQRKFESASKELEDLVSKNSVAALDSEGLTQELTIAREEKVKSESQATKFKKQLNDLTKELNTTREALNSTKKEIVQLKSESKQLTLSKRDMEDRATSAESQLQALKANAMSAIEEKRDFGRSNEEMQSKLKDMETEVLKYKDLCEESKAMTSDMEAAVARGAAAAASSNAKASAAEKAKVVAENQLAELRAQLNLMDATGREAAASIAHRDRARQAQERAESRAAEAEQSAEEANQRAESAIREGEERKRKFAHVQVQFKDTEEKLTKEIDSFKDEILAMKQSLSQVASAKSAAEDRAEGAQNHADEIEKELEKVKKGEQELISALAQAQAECIEARTKASVLEEMAALRKNNFEAATTARVPPSSSPPNLTKVTEPQNSETNRQVDANNDSKAEIEAIRARIFTILGKLKGQVDSNGKPLLSVKEADQSIWGWLGTNTNETETKTSPPPEDEGSSSVDDLLVHLESWANDQGESWSAELNAQSRKAATDAMRKLKESEKELEELRLETSRFKQQDAERSSATVNAAAKRATEAEEKLNALKKKLETLEQRNKELTWQISMYADNGNAMNTSDPKFGSSNNTTPAVGILKQLMLQCTAPRREQQQQH
jgi:predicted  nucleic acid-binding Zn-ribbon protein